MFDKLVESAKQKQGGRARRLFLATVAVYAVALAALGVAAIIGFNSALAEEYDVISSLIPPVPSGPAPQQASRQQNLKQAPAPRFEPPKVIKPLPTLEDMKKFDFGGKKGLIPGAPSEFDGKGGVFGAPGADESAPPPPPPTPTPVVKPAVTPTPVQVVRLTSVLTQGRVLRRVQPPYPAIAQKTRIQGQVQVQIDISETGAVTDVTLLSGHPLLRDAALQAAKQWLFIPTELNGKPVRAIGLLTFNFKLD
jgi:periplasmic protein TonB